MKRPSGTVALLVVACLLTLTGCGNDTASSADGGALARPERLMLGFIPSTEADTLAETAEPMAEYLTQELGIPVESFTATTYAGLVEAMGSGKVDIGWLAPLAYVLARDQNGAEVILKTSRNGAVTYHAMFVARADSGIKSIEEAQGKRMAFVDPASASGYLFPAAYLKDRGHDPETFFSQTLFSGSHDRSVIAVYNGDVDVAAVYDDARNIVARTPAFADVKTKVVKIGQTEEIPNDTVAVRKGLDPELVEQIKNALIKYAGTPEGKKILLDIYEIDGLVPAQDADYDVVRRTARLMGVELESL